MLESCAPGYSIRLATHSRVIKYKGRTYRSLPKFQTLELGHVRKMVRFLGIDKECAAKWIAAV
jgi:hypothetical protein